MTDLVQRLYEEAQDNPDSFEWYAADRIEMLEKAIAEWIDKTEWMQKSSDWQELGMHRADVLKWRIEQLERENAEMKTILDAAIEQHEIGGKLLQEVVTDNARIKDKMESMMDSEQIQQWAREAKLYVDEVDWHGTHHVIGDTHRLQAFAQLVRNATLDEAANLCDDVFHEGRNAIACAVEITRMKS
jgi:hypothetical protein